jgi:hypothetical protein
MSLALEAPSQSEALSSLEVFYQYSLLMKEASFDKAPWNSPWLCALFQIEKHGEKVRMKPGTLVYDEHCRRSSLSKNTVRLTKLSHEGFRKHLRCLLWERLNTRISERDLVSSSLLLFDPCIQPTLHETCPSHHDEASFNQRIRLHLKHVMILDSLHAFGLTEDPKHMERQRSVFTQKPVVSQS